ncbi:MAG TPA: phosphodiester glycosidase family protein [Thermoanaerobaculia bacterium]|nr:phosphodiester glycosidase family protein [Thermoanaerobaculia bacterium]
MRSFLAIFSLVSLLSCSERLPENSAGSRSTAADSASPNESNDDAERCLDEWQQVGEGVRYRTAGCAEAGSAFMLHVVELDPQRWSIDAVDGPRRPIADVVADGAPFAINANFFDVNDRSLGLIVSRGKELRQVHPVSWQSIFSIDRRDQARITRRDDWQRTPPDVVTAVQAGPRLIIDGKRNDVAKATPSLRSGVCITGQGQVRFFVTPPGSYGDVHEMVELAAKSEREDGMGCSDAMLFDGGPSAQMYLDTPGKKISIDGDVVTAFLIAKPDTKTQ